MHRAFTVHRRHSMGNGQPRTWVPREMFQSRVDHARKVKKLGRRAHPAQRREAEKVLMAQKEKARQQDRKKICDGPITTSAASSGCLVSLFSLLLPWNIVKLAVTAAKKS